MRGPTVEECETSQQVIEAVAETTGKDPMEVGPLYHVVDPDALDRLFATTGGVVRNAGYVEFAFAGCEVTVHGDGTVEVTEGADAEDGQARAEADRETDR